METLEEVAENFWLYDDSLSDDDRISYVDGFIKGAKWQQEQDIKKLKPNPLLMDEAGHWDFSRQERTYSEEEVSLFTKMFNLYWCENNSEHEDNLEEWEFSKRLFKKFKKK